MSAKIIAAIVAALGLGFTGTYFATSGDCSGGCPIAKFLHGDSAKPSDCCNPPSDCCEPASACCQKTAKANVPDCCFPGSPCCTGQGGDCCIKDKTQPVSTKADVPACCFPGSPCCEGGDCCLKKDKK